MNTHNTNNLCANMMSRASCKNQAICQIKSDMSGALIKKDKRYIHLYVVALKAQNNISSDMLGHTSRTFKTVVIRQLSRAQEARHFRMGGCRFESPHLQRGKGLFECIKEAYYTTRLHSVWKLHLKTTKNSWRLAHCDL